MFDIAYVGHFTKDTVINPQGSTVHLGGAFYYGANVAARMGLKAAVITRLAQQDWAVVDELTKLGVTMFAKLTPESSNLRIVYPGANLDERMIYAVGYAGHFTVDEVAPVSARVFHIGASVRGEVPREVVQALAQKGTRVSLDVQGYIRVNENGKLAYEPWHHKADLLQFVNVVKADATEAEFLTNTTDMRKAMKMLAALGPQEVVLTQNSGLTVLADGTFYEAPFTPRELRGRTGRGDTCTSAYLCKRLSAGPEEATRFAAEITSRKLEAPGPFRGTVSSEQ